MASHLYLIAYDASVHTLGPGDTYPWFERCEQGEPGLVELKTHWNSNKVAWREGSGALDAWDRARPHVPARWRARLHHFLSHIMLRGEDEGLCPEGPAGPWGPVCTPSMVAHVLGLGDEVWMPYPNAWGDKFARTQEFRDAACGVECGLAEVQRPGVAEHLWVWREGEGADFFIDHVLESGSLLHKVQEMGPTWGLMSWFDF